MTDLFSEIYEERAAICEFDGLLTREEAEKQGLLESEQYRHSCEVRDILSRPLMARRALLADIETRRGKDVADRLRSDMAKLWAERKAA